MKQTALDRARQGLEEGLRQLEEKNKNLTLEDWIAYFDLKVRILLGLVCLDRLEGDDKGEPDLEDAFARQKKWALGDEA